jgi:CubicO group peptidase (beta-lactamase class C family)
VQHCTRLFVAPIICMVIFVATRAPRADAQVTYWPTHGWRYSSPEAQGMDSEVLADAFDYIRDHRTPIHSLTVVRNGYVVLDAYFWPFQDGQPHDLASVTKSVTSTLVGIAIGKHQLAGLTQPLSSVFSGRTIANLDDRKQRVTIERLLTMTSGLDCHADHGEITLSQMMGSADWTQFMLDLPMHDEPGSHFEYCSGGMHLLSGAITKATGLSALDFARSELFDPLGIGKAVWPADANGVSHGWGDLHLQPRDMAKLGYLWLNNGRWENRQLVPAEWMRDAVQVQSHPTSGNGQQYGYGFWVYPDRQPPEFEALGRGGQRISVIPARNLIVVFTGGEFEPGDIGAFIGRAIKSAQPLPEDATGAARLAAAVNDARKPPRPAQLASQLTRTVSGRRYTLGANPLDLKSFVLTFPGAAVGQLELELRDRSDGPRPMGLDGVPRVSTGGRFGLPVSVNGAWEGDSTFVIEYNEIANINTYRFRLTFSDRDVDVEMTERSRAIQSARFHGTSRNSSSSLAGTPALAQVPVPRFMYIYRDSLKRGVDSAYRVIEDHGAQICADLRCPNPYIGIESLSGPHEAWWINVFATEADTARVANVYATNRALSVALGVVAQRKAALIGTPIQGFAVYRRDLSRGPAWSIAGARFIVVTVTRDHRPGNGSVWAMADSTLYVLRPVRTRREADALARQSKARVPSVRPNWSMPAPEWVAADAAFWRSAPAPRARL